MTNAKKALVALLTVLLLASSLGFSLGGSSAETRYTQAINLLQEGKFSEAAPIFQELGYYQDAGQYAMYCSALAEAEKGNFSLTASTMEALTSIMGTFMDSRLLAIYFTGRGYESAQLYEEARTVYQDIRLFKDVQARLDKIPELIKQRDYAAADSLEKKGDRAAKAEDKRTHYNEAKDAFAALGNYSDSKARVAAIVEKLNAMDYADADKLEKEGKLDDAYTAFVKLGSYSDSAARAEALRQQILARDYATAETLEKLGQLEQAENAFLALGDYLDSKERAAKLHEAILQRDYNAARALEEKDDVIAAYEAYLKLGNYLDAADRAAALLPEVNYRNAFSYAESGSYSKARSAYVALGNYKDSAEKARLLGIPAISSNTKRLASGVYSFSMSDSWGLINLNTNQDIGPTWGSIQSFDSNGLAIASYNGKYGLINKSGETILPYSYYDLVSGSNGLYTAATQHSSKSYTFSLIGPKGNVLTSSWAELGSSYASNRWCYTKAPAFTDGVILAKKDSKVYALDQQGKVLLAGRKDISIFTLSTGKYAMRATDKNKKNVDQITFWRMDGTRLTEDTWKSVSDFVGGYAAVQAENSKWGFISKADCQVTIQPQYQSVHSFSENLAAVQTGNLWGFVNAKGEMVIDAQYSSAGDFTGGMSVVRSSLLDEHIITKTGELLYFKEDVYDLAASYDSKAKYEDAIAAFEALNGYGDSTDRALQARDKVNQQIYARAEKLEKEGKLAEAAETFDWLGSYSDAPQRAAAARETLSANTWAAAEKLETEGKLEDAITIYLTLGDYRGAAQHAADLREGINQGIVADAEALAAELRYEEAIALLQKIPEYKDVPQRITAMQDGILLRDYNAAAALEDAGKFEEAINAFAAMNGYSDSADRITGLKEKIKVRDYAKAAELEAQEKYTEAYSLFTELGDYSDSKARAAAVAEKAKEQRLQADYQKALALKEAGKLNEALEAFKALGTYSNSLDHIALLESNVQVLNYNAAVKMLEDGKYSEAITAFKALGDYMDCAAKIKEAQKGVDYNTALSQAMAGKYKEASLAFSRLGNFKDSPKKAEITGTLSTSASKLEKIVDGVMKYQSGGKWGIVNFNTNVVSTAKYTTIERNSSSQYAKHGLLKVYIEGGKPYSSWGTTYDHALDTYGYIDHNGKEIIPCKYLRVTDFDANGNCTVALFQNSKRSGSYYYKRHVFGIMNKNGQTITDAQWRTMGSSSNSDWTNYAYTNRWDDDWCKISSPTFTNGRIKIQTASGTWGFIDQNGKVLGNTNWLWIGEFSEGAARVQNSSNKYTFINEQGQTIGTNTWDEIGNFSNGLAAVKKDGKWGFINKQNQIVIKCQYVKVNSFKSNGTCEVQTSSGTWIVIDKQGKTTY